MFVHRTKSRTSLFRIDQTDRRRFFVWFMSCFPLAEFGLEAPPRSVIKSLFDLDTNTMTIWMQDASDRNRGADPDSPLPRLEWAPRRVCDTVRTIRRNGWKVFAVEDGSIRFD
jgi:hypothetical protein